MSGLQQVRGRDGGRQLYPGDSGRAGICAHPGAERQQVTLLGIHTREFGENTWLDRELLGRHYYEVLNQLAVEPTGVLASRNFQTQQGYKVGDTIRYYSGSKKEIRGKIVDFVDYWPGYEPTTVSLQAEGGVSTRDNFLLIANYATLQKTLGTVPYEVDLPEGRARSGGTVPMDPG